MDDHVGDVRALAADALLDLARARVRVVEPARAVEAEREERDEAGVGAQEAERARLATRHVTHDAPNERLRVGVDLVGRCSPP